MKFPSAASPPNLDAFTCYSAEHPRGTAGFTRPASVHLQDQFEGSKTGVGVPNMLCVAELDLVQRLRRLDDDRQPDSVHRVLRDHVGQGHDPDGLRQEPLRGGCDQGRSDPSELCLPSMKVEVLPSTTTTVPPSTTSGPTTTTTVPGTFSPITSYSDSTIRSPIDITVGPDGALWFTNAGNDSIGRITTNGVISNFTDPSIASPDGITARSGRRAVVHQRKNEHDRPDHELSGRSRTTATR